MTKAPQKGKSLEKSEGQVLLYQTEEGQTKLEVQLRGGDCLFYSKSYGKAVSDKRFKYQYSYPKHLQRGGSKNSVIKEFLITSSDEATVKDSLTVQKEESSMVKRPQDFYSLDILFLEYRIKSLTATHFRQ